MNLLSAARTLLILGLLATAAPALADAPQGPAAPRAQERALDQASFDQVWTTIRDQHFDPTLGGLDWNSVRVRYQSRLDAATTATDVRRVLLEMISTLGQSHFDIIPAGAYDSIAGADTATGYVGRTGLEVRVVDERALITGVVAGSPAETAGIKPGWEVIALDGVDAREHLRVLAEELGDKPLRATYLSGSAYRACQGRVGEKVSLQLLDGRDQPHELELEYVEETRGEILRYGNIPNLRIFTESRELAGGIGYFKFSGFFNPNYVMKNYNALMRRSQNAPGVVIDVRANGGGMGTMAMGMIGWLLQGEPALLGTEILRGGELKLIVPPRAETYAGPVVVLVDEFSGSAAEFFALGVQDTGRGHIIGTRTSGAMLGCQITRLPNGDGFVYAVMDFISARTGQSKEGIGVIPDLQIRPTRAALLEGRDLVLEAAIAWIESQHQH